MATATKSAAKKAAQKAVKANKERKVGTNAGRLLGQRHRDESAAAAKRLPINRRMEIFAALVETQDLLKMTVEESEDEIAKLYRIDSYILKCIIDEGIENTWAPLS